MSTRVQVILADAEKARMQSEARRSGMSLSAWLREVALERLAARKAPDLTRREELRRFFASCDEREKGREPDWADHLHVIARSRAQGSTGT